MANLTILSDRTKKPCLFCGSDVVDPVLYGDLYQLGDIVAHHFCALLSHNIDQKGQDEEGILGFLAPDIHAVLKRARRINCVFCGKHTASIRCSYLKCKIKFHLPCGLKNGTASVFKGRFSSFCIKHRLKQKIPKESLYFLETFNPTCVICDGILDSTDLNNTLWAPCCKRSFYHRYCLQKLALNTGYLFMCSICRDKDNFNKWMVKFGIFVPEREAAWEQEPNAFADLYTGHVTCDAEICICPDVRGRKKNGIKKWKIIVCRTCGATGLHVECGKLRTPYPSFECGDCKNIGSRVSSTSSDNMPLSELVKRGAFSKNLKERSKNFRKEDQRSKKNIDKPSKSEVPRKREKSEPESRGEKRKRLSDDGELCIKTTKEFLKDKATAAKKSKNIAEKPGEADVQEIVSSSGMNAAGKMEKEMIQGKEDVEMVEEEKDVEVVEEENDVTIVQEKNDCLQNKENEVLFTFCGVQITQPALDSIQDGQNISPIIMDAFIGKLKAEGKDEREGIHFLEAKIWSSILQKKSISEIVNDLKQEFDLKSLRNSAKSLTLMPAYFEQHESWSLIYIRRKKVDLLETNFYAPHQKAVEIDFEEKHLEKLNDFLFKLLDVRENQMKLQFKMHEPSLDEKITSDEYGMHVMKTLEDAALKKRGQINFEDVQKLRKELRDNLMKRWEELKYPIGDVRYWYKEEEVFGSSYKSLTGKDLNSLKENHNPTIKIMDFFIDFTSKKYMLNRMFTSVHTTLVLKYRFFSESNLQNLKLGESLFVPVVLQGANTLIWSALELIQDDLYGTLECVPYFFGDKFRYSSSIDSLMKEVRATIKKKPFTDIGEFKVLKPKFEAFGLDCDDTGICLLYFSERKLMDVSGAPQPVYSNMTDLRQHIFAKIWERISSEIEVVVVDDSDSEIEVVSPS